MWKSLLAQSGGHVVLNAELIIVATSGSLLHLVVADRRTLPGRSILAVLAEQDAAVLGGSFAAEVATSLSQVCSTQTAHATAAFTLQDSSHSQPDHHLRSIRAVHEPVFGPAGELAFIVQRIEDLTRPLAWASEWNDHGAVLAREADARVQERTSELEHANEQLLREIAGHMKTEKVLQRTLEKLHHTQKLEAVGRLAGGIAHDFNNILSVVLGYSISIIAELPVGSPMRASVEEIRRAGERAAELTQQLLAFGRQQVLAPKVLDINDVVGRVDRMIRRILGEDIDLVTLPERQLWNVKVDPGQLEQIIMNLVINARDAMPDGGTLTVETQNIEFDEEYAHAHLGASAGPHAVLAVSDTGLGMDKQTQARIFEPFFTTKEKGKGTGLGLSTVFGIVKQSGGHVWFYSELNEGTTFKVCFPRTADSQVQPRRASSRPVVPLSVGNETILLVEDDPQLRVLARTLLIRQGYQVLDAPSAAEALVMSARFSGKIALLVTDVVMPRMNGRELARRLAETRPATKVLYMSGYTDNAIVQNGILDPNVAFLQKPLIPETFARRVRQVLDSTGS